MVHCNKISDEQTSLDFSGSSPTVSDSRLLSHIRLNAQDIITPVKYNAKLSRVGNALDDTKQPTENDFHETGQLVVQSTVSFGGADASDCGRHSRAVNISSQNKPIEMVMNLRSPSPIHVYKSVPNQEKFMHLVCNEGSWRNEASNNKVGMVVETSSTQSAPNGPVEVVLNGNVSTSVNILKLGNNSYLE